MSRWSSPVLASLALAIPSVSLAQDVEYASEPQEVLFEDHFDAFEAIEFDTGPVPSGSPVAVQFYLKSRGGSYAEMEAVSDVTWPDALTHQLNGVPGTGLFELVCNLDLVAQVTFDIWDFKGAYIVWEENLDLDDAIEFDPLLLPEGSPEVVQLSVDGEGIVDPYRTSIPLFAGLRLDFVADLFPRVTGSLRGDRIVTNEAVQTSAVVSTLHDVPERDPGLLEMESIYFARVGAALDVVIRPEIELCAPIIGCFRVARFDVPIGLVDEDVEREFKPVWYEHPLPAMEAPVTTHDFGEVEVGTLANLQLPLSNIGLMDLEGTLTIESESDGVFSVFPEYFQAGPDNTDGAVVTFAPGAEGLQSAVLVITSNDPLRPELRIPIAGTGWVEPVEELVDPAEDGRLSGEVRGCGCSSGSTSGSGLAALLGGLALVLVARRRR